MKRELLFCISIILFSGLLYSQEWTVTEVATCPNDKAYGICLGNGHNDGTNRLYVSTRGEATDGAIYEYTYQSGSWQLTATVGTGLRNLVTIAVGDGRNDDINRLYAVEWGGVSSNIYEFTWNGSTWVKVTMASPAKPMLSVVIGDARGDGVHRVYVAGWIIHREYEWNGTGWDYTNISIAHGAEGPVFFGRGRNDGVLRYYTPGNHVKEFTWSGTAWSDSSSVSATGGAPETVVIVDGRNDGIERIYTQDNSGTHEITRNGASWTSQMISTQSGRSFIMSAKTKSDGKNYLYNTDIASPLREYKYNSGTGLYEYTTIDAATGATALIDVGAGRNDNVVRIYTPGYAAGKIYEITNTNPMILDLPAEISGDDIICPEGTGVVSTGVFESYQWFRRYFGSTETIPIPTEYGQSVTMDFYDYAASYLSVEVSVGSSRFTSAEFFVDGYAFSPPTVMTTGEFTIGSEGQSLLCEGDVMYFTLSDPFNTNIVWYKDGNPIAGQTSQILTVTEPGTYSVEGAPSECPAFIQNPGVPLVVELCDPSSINGQHDNFDLRIYPNPVRDKLYLYPANKISGADYTIFDNAGREVKKGRLNEDAAIDFSGIKNGIYYLQLDKNPDVRYKISKTGR